MEGVGVGFGMTLEGVGVGFVENCLYLNDPGVIQVWELFLLRIAFILWAFHNFILWAFQNGGF